MVNILRRATLLIIMLLLLIGCSAPEATATPNSEVSDVPVEAATEEIPDTATPEPEPTETETAVPPTETHTPQPTATETLVPPTETNTPEPTATEPPTATQAPPTEPPVTATTAAPPPAPPRAPAPTGANLLVNPSFESGSSSWFRPNGNGASFTFYEANGNPQFVHSGQRAPVWGPFMQHVPNVTIGTTYRAGVWVKIWSSSGEDRTISENPGDFVARVCISPSGIEDFKPESMVCSSWVRPLDVWQFISVDSVANNSQIVIILQSAFSGENRPAHNEAIFDDATLGTAPTSATATPPPPSSAAAARPAPIPFDGIGLRDNMTYMRSQIEQMGGVLDRLFNGENGKCSEYQDYYANITRSATYHSVPDAWHGAYNEYIFAVENALATSMPINDLCNSGGGVITPLNYGAARQGINNSIDRLIPAIDLANSLLGG